MDELNQILESGKIEDYCLGLLPDAEAAWVETMAARHSQVKSEIRQTQFALEHFALVEAKSPAPALKAKILGAIHALETESYDLNDLPILGPQNDLPKWLKTIEGLTPTEAYDGISLRILRSNDQVTQCLAWLDTQLVEGHHDEDEFRESFLILGGHCECDLGGHVFRLTAGGYFEVPPHTVHKLTNLDPNGQVIAIVQRLRAA